MPDIPTEALTWAEAAQVAKDELLAIEAKRAALAEREADLEPIAEQPAELTDADRLTQRHNAELQRVKTLAYADGVAAGRAQAAADIAEKIENNVRHPDWDKQDRGGFDGFVPKMAYVAGHDKAAAIARAAAVAEEGDTPDA